MSTKLPATQRFFQPEISKVYLHLVLANYKAGPSRTEIAASTDLTDEIADLAGWGVSSNLIPTPDLGHRFVGNIGGRTTTETSTITFYGDLAGEDVRNVLARGTRGFITFADGGDVPGSPADTFPIEVTSVGKVRSTGEQVYQLTITFAITGPPAEDVPLPATGP
jgi:hypothetical protein